MEENVNNGLREIEGIEELLYYNKDIYFKNMWLF